MSGPRSDRPPRLAPSAPPSRNSRSRLRLARPRLLAIAAVALLLAAAAVLRFAPFDAAAYLQPSASTELLDESGLLLHVSLNAVDHWCLPRPLAQISPWLVQATIAAEDARFRRHPGVDPFAVARAAWGNLREGRVVSGASTLDMQVVKLSRGPARSLAAKALQALQALCLRRRAGADAVLQAYLNRAPYGMNLTGCEAAARRYFGRPASQLSLDQAALLAGLPRAPGRLMPLENPEAARCRRRYVLQQMRENGVISQTEFQRADAAPLRVSRRPMPALAPHVATRLAPLARSQHDPRLRTTLHADLQRAAERMAARHVAALKGAADGVALIAIDIATRRVRAWVGSPDFHAPAPAAQFDAARARRSPGSALKPFLYALAIERHLLYPTETLFDGVLDYGVWQPANFDRNHKGLLPAADALRLSRNIPAVTVLERVGSAQTREFLTGIGLGTLDRSAEDYGLGFALGTCEVRLDQLTAAYATLAGLGVARPLRVLADQPRAPAPTAPWAALSPGVCLSVLDALRQPLPGESDLDRDDRLHAPSPVSWKTGTSAGNRDAWAFVMDRALVVGVWVGRTDGAPAPRLVGADVALPLAGEFFRAACDLQPLSEAPPAPHDALQEVVICARSGLPASPWCPHSRTAQLPNTCYLNRTCAVHWPAQADGDARVVERWPASARSWDLAAVAKDPVAPHRGKATNLDAVAPPESAALRSLQILEPADGAEYVLTRRADGDRLNLRSSRDQTRAVHWYLDGRYVGLAEPGRQESIALTTGGHDVSCMTADGATASARFRVLRAPGGRSFRSD